MNIPSLRILIIAGALLGISGCSYIKEAFEDAMNENANNVVMKTLDDGGFGKASKIAKSKDYEYVLQFNRIPQNPNHPDMTVMPVPQAGNLPPMVVERNLFCHSRDIMDIELVPSSNRVGYYNLGLILSSRGKKRWEAMSGECVGQPIAILMDGEYQRYFYMDKIYNPDREKMVIVKANFSERLAKKIKAAAPKNYKHYNKSPMRIFQ